MLGIASVAGCIGDDDDDDDGTDDTDDTMDDSDDEPDEDDIVIGSLQGFSGTFPPMAEAHQAGIEFAISEINADGGVLDRNLAVTSVDTEGDPSAAITQFTRFVEEDDIIAAVGPIVSDIALAVSEEAEAIGVPFLPHVGASHALLTRDSRYTFRTHSHPSPGFAEAAIELILDEGYSLGGVVYADFAWGHSYEAILGQQLPDGVTLEEHMAPVGEQDFTSYLREMSSDIEFLLGAGHPPGEVNLYLQMQELELTPDVVPGSAITPEMMWAGVGDALIGPYAQYSMVDYLSDEYQAVGERYGDETGNFFGSAEAAGYMVMHMIAQALEDAGSVDHDAVADALRAGTFDLFTIEPLEYTEWGELDGMPLRYYSFVEENPDFFPENEFFLEELYTSPPLEPFDPDTDI